MINGVSIVVLTPVKNEDWILEIFLNISSLFADYILIADQHSTDKTKELINSYPKAVYILNECQEYDEEYRQKLLIEKAREIVKGRRLLIAIDADEVISANSIYSIEWEKICSQPLGTQIFFKKPDALAGLNEIMDYPNYFYLGYLDDGKEHKGSKFHSPRLPNSEKKYIANDITFIHLALARELEYNARQRLYTMLENINSTANLQFRYRKYSRKMQMTLRQYLIRPLPANWKSYPIQNINISAFTTTDVNNYNYQILKIFNEYGYKRFWADDIWYVNYNEINKKMGGICKREIVYPPIHIKAASSILIDIYRYLLLFKNRYLKETNK